MCRAIRGPARARERNAVLHELSGKRATARCLRVRDLDRGARRAKAIVTGRVDGEIHGGPRGIEDLAMIPFSIFPAWKRISRNLPEQKTI